MYQKVLIPLDGSREAEQVLPAVEDKISEQGEVIFLQVVPGKTTQVVHDEREAGAEVPETATSEIATAIDYLRELVSKVWGDDNPRRCVVVSSDSVPNGIVDFARMEDVDLIAMYTHDRKGLSRLIKGSIAKQVQNETGIDMQILKPSELVGV